MVGSNNESGELNRSFRVFDFHLPLAKAWSIPVGIMIRIFYFLEKFYSLLNIVGAKNLMNNPINPLDEFLSLMIRTKSQPTGTAMRKKNKR